MRVFSAIAIGIAVLMISAGCHTSSHTSVRYHEREVHPGVRQTADDGLSSEYQMQSPGDMVSPGEMASPGGMVVEPSRSD